MLWACCQSPILSSASSSPSFWLSGGWHERKNRLEEWRTHLHIRHHYMLFCSLSRLVSLRGFLSSETDDTQHLCCFIQLTSHTNAKSNYPQLLLQNLDIHIFIWNEIKCLNLAATNNILIICEFCFLFIWYSTSCPMLCINCTVNALCQSTRKKWNYIHNINL